MLQGREQAEEEDRLTVFFSLTYGRDLAGGLRTWVEKQPPEYYAERAGSLGIDALGVNCGRDIDMAEIIAIVRRYRRVTDLPLFARPNAGTPQRLDGRWIYPRTPRQMAEHLPELLEAGVNMVGGCCGTTPAHIASFHEIIEAVGV